MKKILAVFMFCILALAPVSSYAASGQALADEGADWVLGIVFHNDTQVDTHLKLYCGDHSPASGDVYADYTNTHHWCSGGGYADKTLTRGTNWVITTANDPSDAIYSGGTPQDFSFTGPLTTYTTIYGYCITNAADTILIGCEALTSSFTPDNGYHLYITPKIKLSHGTAGT